MFDELGKIQVSRKKSRADRWYEGRELEAFIDIFVARYLDVTEVFNESQS